MNIPCDTIQDLMPLVKDNVASEASIHLVYEHLKNCESCQEAFEKYALPVKNDINDKSVLSSIEKKLFLISSAFLVLGTLIGMVLKNDSSPYTLEIVMAVLFIIITGTLLFRAKLKEGEHMRKFFVGKAIGTFVIFAFIGMYLLLKYVFFVF